VSLSRHLTSPGGEHGRLGFHPDCPRCRAERLAGDLGRDALVSRRTQAALAAGVLAFSVAAPPVVAVAQEPDQQQEGGSDPGVEPPEVAPEIDPGGDEEGFDEHTVPFGDPAVGGGDDDGSGPALEAEPPAGTVPQSQPTPAPGPPQPTPAAETTPDPLPAPTPPPIGTPPAPPTAAPTAPEELVDTIEGTPKQRRANLRERARKPVRSVLPPASAPVPIPAPTSPAPVPSPVPAAPAAAVETVPASQGAQRTGGTVKGDAYTVRDGDSLWAIARRVLGPGASTGRVAREVSRLWELNADRIGTGNPSLLYVGTVLRLR
jgi:hypothetical protein